MSDQAPHLPPHLEGQSSWLSKATSASILGHPLVWTAMTALFILIGYLWLQYYALPLSDSLGPSYSETELIGAKEGDTWNPEIYRDIKTEEQMTITRKGDDLRADNYREVVDLENRIQPLLRLARQFMEREAYTGIDHNNAWNAYQGVLSIDPEHRVAQSGQAQIIGLLQGNAEYALEEGQYEEAEKWLGELDIIQQGADFQQQLRRQIAEQIALEVAMFEEEQRIEERNRLLASALSDADAALLMDPPELRVAYDLYMRVLELDVENADAQAGLQLIYRRRVALAEAAIEQRDYDEALKQTERLVETDAPKELIEALRESIEQARRQDRLEAEAEQNRVRATQARAAAETAQAPAEIAPVGQAPSESSSTEARSEGVEVGARPEDPRPARNELSIVQTGIMTDPVSDPAPPASFEMQPTPPVTDIRTDEIEVHKPASGPKVKTSRVEIDAARASTKTEPTLSPRAKQLSTGINAYYAGDYNTAFTALHPLAEDNSPRAQFRLGVMYYQGRTVVKNEDLARQWIARALPAILRAAQQGQAWAQADLGTAYELGIGVKHDLQAAATLYEKAAVQGYVGGQTNLGVLYGTGVGVKYDRQAAVYWLKKAAEQGDKVAQDNLKILDAR